jgi:hypothetical protein
MSSPFNDPCLKWRKAGRSTGQGSECVEVARVAATVGVRDSKNPDGAKLAFSAGATRSLARKIKAGQLDL